MSGLNVCSSSAVLTRLCRRGARINNTFHAFWCQRHAAVLTVRLKKRESASWNFHVWRLRETEDDFLIQLIFFLFSSNEPWTHLVLVVPEFSVTLWTPVTSLTLRLKTIVCHCMSQVWANQMWILILQHITQGLLMWRSMRGAASIWKAAPLLIKPRPRVFTQHFWFHLELAAVTGQLMSLITL